MILNTTNEGTVRQNLPVLYVPIDPKYLYYEKKPMRYMSGTSLSLSDDKSVIDGCGLDDLMNQRSEIIHSKIGLLLSEIYQRQALKKDNLYGIDLDQCACRNLIYQRDEDLWDRTRIGIEEKIIDLEQEKRREKANYFRDILLLKKELRESLIENLEEKQKAAMLLI